MAEERKFDDFASSTAASAPSTASASAPAKSLGKGSKLLLAHEKQLFEQGKLVNATHSAASSIWLEAPSTASDAIPKDATLVYRPMGDDEIKYLVEHNQLPSTQPYQAIIEGERGRTYSEKYLNGAKWTNTHPSTVVEFLVPAELVAILFAKQHKAEDGAISMGLGDKAGGGLGLFNQYLADSRSTWRIVKVKRRVSTPAAKRKY